MAALAQPQVPACRAQCDPTRGCTLGPRGPPRLAANEWGSLEPAHGRTTFCLALLRPELTSMLEFPRALSKLNGLVSRLRNCLPTWPRPQPARRKIGPKAADTAHGHLHHLACSQRLQLNSITGSETCGYLQLLTKTLHAAFCLACFMSVTEEAGPATVRRSARLFGSFLPVPPLCHACAIQMY